jgi:hypothetical protein
MRSLKRLPQKISPVPCLPREEGGPPCGRVVERHTYLRVGDRVFHKNFRSWGCGMVIEAWISEVPGGLCFARVQFQDGKKRVFDNSFDSSSCCYYTGITLLNRIALT